MKTKRFLSLVLLIATVMCFSIIPKNTLTGFAQTNDIVRIAGYQYTISEIFDKANAGSSTSKTIKINDQLFSDDEANLELCKQAGFLPSGSTVEFLKSNETYKFDVYDANSQLEKTFNVKTISYTEIDETSMRYELSTEKTDAVIDACNKQAETLKVKDSFSFTDTKVLEALKATIVSDYFDYSSLTKTYYYLAPGSTSYTSTTSSKFKLNSAGTYYFYVLAKDEFKNTMSVKDLVIGNNGWYAKDADDNPTGDVIVPIFSFNVEKITAPEITVTTSESGYLNLTYYVKSFTVSSDDYDSEYTLYYCENEYDKDDEKYATDDDYIKAVTSDATTVDVTSELFDSEDVSFVPNKKGYYYVLIRAVDSANMGEEAMSRVISVQSEYKTVKIESEFFKNNVVSVIFLSISLACAIALVCLICIKPKDVENELPTKQ